MSKEEPAWRAELREALDERFPFVRTTVTRDEIRLFIEEQIKAAEQRGFQAGVNKTGDSVGKLREQLKTAREDARREAAEEIRNAPMPEDGYYNRADAAAVIDPDKP